jgi:3'-5' exoribonuclease
MIKDLVVNSRVDGVFLIKDSNRSVTQKGQTYFNLILQDASGSIEAKKRTIEPGDDELFAQGNIVMADGDVVEFNGHLQIKVISASICDKKDIDISELVPSSPIPYDTLKNELLFFVDSIKDVDCKKIVLEIMKEHQKEFLTYPAASKNHHAFYHGLLYHVVGMCKLADHVAKLYNDVDHDLLISGCILHDLGKIVELSGPVATHYTDEGLLLGHLTIGMSMVREMADKLGIKSEVPMLLEHMIISHHGKPEYGSSVMPMTREALLLSMIDDLDAKMMMLDMAYKDTKEGDFTERIFALDNRSFYKEKKR